MKNDKALIVAEHMIDFYYQKKQQENLKRYQWIQRKNTLKDTKKNLIDCTLAGMIIFALCFTMLDLEMRARRHSENINVIQSKLEEVKNQNTDAMKRLSDTADYQHIREEAHKMGMSHADKDRIIYYDISESDYMIQVKDIPKE